MIYSCSMFFNEFDLLDLKIAEEINIVDKIILVESTKTHSNQNKNLLLKNNPKYVHPKIEIVVVGEDFSNSKFDNEASQRNASIKAMQQLKDDDVIISCDLDEILCEEDISKVVEKTKEKKYIKIGMKSHFYKINLLFGTWKSPIAVTGKVLKENKMDLTKLRHDRAGVLVNTNGHHFSYLGTPENIKLKLDSFKHSDVSSKVKKIDWIKERIANKEDILKRKGRVGTIVPIDHTYPKTILNNLEQWEKHIEKE